MGFVLFNFTLLVLLASILASATCLSAYLVSHKRTMFLAFLAFLFYFFDVAWVFQDAFVYDGTAIALGDIYVVIRSVALVVVGGGFLVSFWLLICDYLGETRRAMLIAPGVVFVLGSLALLVVMPEGNTQRFLFYSMRVVFLFWILLVIAYRYVAMGNEIEKSRLKRHRGIYVLLWVLGFGVLLEDVYAFFIFDPSATEGMLSYFAERNYLENVLMLICAFFACRDAARSLSLRFDRPPTHGAKLQESLLDGSVMVYGKRHSLSEREQEVLHLVLLGKDNQNIASEMHLALGTVKVHIHNILQKTGQSNRQALIQDFWKTS